MRKSYALLALGLTVPGAAQMRDCPAIDNTPGLKLVLDDVRPSTSAAAAARRMYSAIDQNLDAIRQQFQGRITLLHCQGRLPRDVGDFPKDMAENLNAKDVLFEVWGTVATAPSIGFAVIPARHYGIYDTPPQTLGVYNVPQGADPETFFRPKHEFEGYVNVAMGVKLMKNRKFVDAVHYFCTGRTLLQRASPGRVAVDFIRFVDDLAAKSAESDPSLKDVDAFHYTAGTTQSRCP